MKKYFGLLILALALTICGCKSNETSAIPAAIDEIESKSETESNYDSEKTAQFIEEINDDSLNENDILDNIKYGKFSYNDYLNVFSPIEKDYENYNKAIYSIVDCNEDTLFLVVNGAIDGDYNDYEAIYIYNGIDTKKFYAESNIDDDFGVLIDSEIYINEDTSNIIISNVDFIDEMETFDFYKYDNMNYLHICTVTKNFASCDYKIESEDGIINDSETLSIFENNLFENFGEFIFDDYSLIMNENYDRVSKYEGFHENTKSALDGYFRL